MDPQITLNVKSPEAATVASASSPQTDRKKAAATSFKKPNLRIDTSFRTEGSIRIIAREVITTTKVSPVQRPPEPVVIPKATIVAPKPIPEERIKHDGINYKKLSIPGAFSNIGGLLIVTTNKKGAEKAPKKPSPASEAADKAPRKLTSAEIVELGWKFFYFQNSKNTCHVVEVSDKLMEHNEWDLVADWTLRLQCTDDIFPGGEHYRQERIGHIFHEIFTTNKPLEVALKYLDVSFSKILPPKRKIFLFGRLIDFHLERGNVDIAHRMLFPPASTLTADARLEATSDLTTAQIKMKGKKLESALAIAKRRIFVVDPKTNSLKFPDLYSKFLCSWIKFTRSPKTSPTFIEGFKVIRYLPDTYREELIYSPTIKGELWEPMFEIQKELDKREHRYLSLAKLFIGKGKIDQAFDFTKYFKTPVIIFGFIFSLLEAKLTASQEFQVLEWANKLPGEFRYLFFLHNQKKQTPLGNKIAKEFDLSAYQKKAREDIFREPSISTEDQEANFFKEMREKRGKLTEAQEKEMQSLITRRSAYNSLVAPILYVYTSAEFVPKYYASGVYNLIHEYLESVITPWFPN